MTRRLFGERPLSEPMVALFIDALMSEIWKKYQRNRHFQHVLSNNSLFKFLTYTWSIKINQHTSLKSENFKDVYQSDVVQVEKKTL